MAENQITEYQAPSQISMFAVRQINTGLYFHAAKGAFTFNDPAEIGSHCLPRLFTSVQGAKIAVAAWRKGVWHKHRDSYQSYQGDHEYDEWFEIKPVEYRKDMKLEIVPVSILIYDFPQGTK